MSVKMAANGIRTHACSPAPTRNVPWNEWIEII